VVSSWEDLEGVPLKPGLRQTAPVSLCAEGALEVPPRETVWVPALGPGAVFRLRCRLAGPIPELCSSSGALWPLLPIPLSPRRPRNDTEGAQSSGEGSQAAAPHSLHCLPLSPPHPVLCLEPSPTPCFSSSCHPHRPPLIVRRHLTHRGGAPPASGALGGVGMPPVPHRGHTGHWPLLLFWICVHAHNLDVPLPCSPRGVTGRQSWCAVAPAVQGSAAHALQPRHVQVQQ